MSTTRRSTIFEALLRRQLPALSSGQDIPAGPLIDLGLDSLGAMTLLTDVEEQFGIEFGDDVLDPMLFSSADHLWSVVQRLLKEQSAPQPGVTEVI